MSKLFDKLIVHTAYLYVSEALKDENVYQKDKLHTLKSKLSGLHIAYKFTDAEHKTLVKAGDTDEAKRIKSVEIDFSIFAIVLLYEYVNDKPKSERIRFNISDENIKKIKSTIVKDMLELKFRNSDIYDSTKDIIRQSEATAREFYNYFKGELCRIG